MPEESQLHNEVSGPVSGTVVQVQSVSGGIHVHSARPGLVTPRQLPAAPALFTGRVPELSALTEAWEAGELPGATMVISAISGVGGIGKTWLALQWAHEHAAAFPDGQLFVDLRGFSPSLQPMSPATAVRGFLDALGVEPAAIPVELDAQAALYRSLVAGRRMLIVFDNARDSTQIADLLPGSPTCTVLITSRRQLASLVARHGARLVGLNVLMDEEARELFARHVGAGRAAAEPDAVAELLRWCAGLPLAIGIVAARVARYPQFPLAELADELREASARLDAMDGHELTVNLRAVFSWSYRALAPEPARMFGLLGLSPGPDIGLRAAANLAGLSPARTRAVLGELEDASLILRPAPSRYQVHDLVRLYAAECAEADLDPNARGEARRRLLDYYVHTAHAGDRVLHPHRDLVEPEPAGGECRPDPLTTEPEALAWFDAEHASLLLVQEQALAQGWNRAAWQLAWTLDTFHWRRGHLRDDVTVWQAALTASERLDEPLPKVKADRRLGLALARVGGHEAALDYLRKSLELAERIGDRNEQAHIHWCFAWTWDNQREDARALDHAERALSLFRELGQPEWEAETRNEMGRYCARLGHLDEARAHCEAALALCREHGYVEGEASVLDVLGFVARQAGQYSPAIEHYRQALRLYRDLGYSYEEPNVLDGLGHAHVGGDSPGDARQAWLQALDLYAGQHRTADAERMDRQITALGAP